MCSPRWKAQHRLVLGAALEFSVVLKVSVVCAEAKVKVGKAQGFVVIVGGSVGGNCKNT